MSGVTLPVTRANSRPGDPLINKSTGEQLVILRERCERLAAESSDMKRRIQDKDDRATEVQKLLSAAQARNAKSQEQLAVEQAERKLIEQSCARAESSAGTLRSQLTPLQTRTDRAEAEAAQLRAQLEALTKQHDPIVIECAELKEQLHEMRERAARADADALLGGGLLLQPRSLRHAGALRLLHAHAFPGRGDRHCRARVVRSV